MLNRRRFLSLAVTASAGPHLMGFAGTAAAVPNTTALVRLMVGFPAGGAVDIVARLIAAHIEGYASSLIVENHPGAGGRLALKLLKGSDADGSVMLLTPVDQLSLFPHVYGRLSYRPLEDFTPVSTICSTEFLLAVGPRVPPQVRGLSDFIAWCRKNPDAAEYGSAGAGTHPHFLGVMLAHAAAFSFAHVPYKGGVTAVQDVLGGHLAACISTIGTLLPSVQNDGLRALATTAPHRSSALPDVPTFNEAGYPGLVSLERFGLLLPAGTPLAKVQQLHDAARDAVQTESVTTGLQKLSLEAATSSPEEFAHLIALETHHWAEVVQSSGFRPMD
jgi:tripartite-type tricarboxylate transporter receptor subunit TctC